MSPRLPNTVALVLAAACGCDAGGADGPDADADASTDAGDFVDVEATVHHRSPDTDAMAAIPASTFAMGHPVERPGGYGQPWKENELPEHEVTLPAYFIDDREVTVVEYAEFLAAEGGEVHRHPLQPIVRSGRDYAAADGAADLPISLVSWFDAVTFCAWAGKRLPTEAEWERAARGPDGSLFPWGEDWPTCAHAAFNAGSTFCAEAPLPAGSHSPPGDSAEGCRDMSGNVAEWVADVYDRYPSEPQTDPHGPANGRYRVVRGGGFHEGSAALRSTARWAADPADRSVGVGFRCAVRP
ncbi:MAG: SUMF1/EgtB/PvdO family nonheme iron enzyme [Deltaproteobacteria bacterium]|nr:SUMF1/EgtB/PvdO family nonheme iron enzyme [Deltaproteobacteria bacterium]